AGRPCQISPKRNGSGSQQLSGIDLAHPRRIMDAAIRGAWAMAQSNTTQSNNVNRRELLAGASVGAAALLAAGNAQAQSAPGRAIVFAQTTIVTPDTTNDDFALAVMGDRIAAIGPSAAVLAQYPDAEIVDGRGKAILPGLINCHAHLTATL